MIFIEDLHEYNLDKNYVERSNRDSSLIDQELLEALNRHHVPFTSITTFLKEFEPFIDWEAKKKGVANKRGLTVAQVTKIWDKAKNDGTKRGSKHHLKREKETIKKIKSNQSNSSLYRHKLTKEGYKWDDVLILEPSTTYPEKIVWLNELRLCGTSDLVITTDDNIVNIDDYKTNKKLSYMSWSGEFRGIPEYMNTPVSHLENCDMSKYGLQLSLYMYMFLIHNPDYKAGNLRILHERFDEKGKYTHTETHNLRFLFQEVEAILEYRRDYLYRKYVLGEKIDKY